MECKFRSYAQIQRISVAENISLENQSINILTKLYSFNYVEELLRGEIQ